LQNASLKSTPFSGMRFPLWACLLTLLVLAVLHHDALSQDSASAKSTKPATEPKVILEAKGSAFAVWLNPSYSQPRLLLRVFSDKTAEVYPYLKDVKRTTLTPEQFEKIRFFLDQPDLLALGSPYCGSGGADQVSFTNIELSHRERQQIVHFANFWPRDGRTAWPGTCPKIVVKLQCTVENLIGEPDSKVSHWQEDCADILAK
jgi:hypothetical protein